MISEYGNMIMISEYGNMIMISAYGITYMIWLCDACVNYCAGI